GEEESPFPLQSQAVLGREGERYTGDDSARSQQSRRRRLDCAFQGALWDSWRPRAVEDRLHAVAWVHTAHQLGCDETGRHGQAGHAGNTAGMRRFRDRGIGIYFAGFASGVLFLAILLKVSGTVGPTYVISPAR